MIHAEPERTPFGIMATCAITVCVIVVSATKCSVENGFASPRTAGILGLAALILFCAKMVSRALIESDAPQKDTD